MSFQTSQSQSWQLGKKQNKKQQSEAHSADWLAYFTLVELVVFLVVLDSVSTFGVSRFSIQVIS